LTQVIFYSKKKQMHAQVNPCVILIGCHSLPLSRNLTMLLKNWKKFLWWISLRIDP